MDKVSGLILIDKSSGSSSKDVSRILQKKLGKDIKMGHCGTLDPLASGILPIVIGKATKLQSYLTGGDKSYEFTMLLGADSETLDTDCKQIHFTQVPQLSKQELVARLTEAVGECLGVQNQVPPLFCAKKYKGKPLYQYARNNISLDKPIESFAKTVEIYELNVLDIREDITQVSNQVSIDLSMSCSSGTFVRSVCRDIAKKLGTTAIVTKLSRTKLLGFELKHTYQQNNLETANIDEILANIIPISKIKTQNFNNIMFYNSNMANKILNGSKVILDKNSIFEEVSCDSDILSNENNIFLNNKNEAFGLGSIKLFNDTHYEIKMFRGLL